MYSHSRGCAGTAGRTAPAAGASRLRVGSDRLRQPFGLVLPSRDEPGTVLYGLPLLAFSFIYQKDHFFMEKVYNPTKTASSGRKVSWGVKSVPPRIIILAVSTKSWSCRERARADSFRPIAAVCQGAVGFFRTAHSRCNEECSYHSSAHMFG